MNNNNEASWQNGPVSLAVLKEARIIYINGEVTQDLAYHFNIALLEFEQANPTEDVTVYVNSPGGSVVDGLSMIDTMNLVSCEVSTVCVGRAASMGAMMLMCGERGKRKALPHSTVLIHQPLGGLAPGHHQATEIELAAKGIIRTRDVLYKMIHERTGQSLEKIASDCERDYEMYAEEALAYGIVDEIVKSRKGGVK